MGAQIKQADITRMIRGAMKAGLSLGDFQVIQENGQLRLLPTTSGAALSEADDLERRMQEAFGK